MAAPFDFATVVKFANLTCDFRLSVYLDSTGIKGEVALREPIISGFKSKFSNDV